jgi:hypothetical protein
MKLDNERDQFLEKYVEKKITIAMYECFYLLLNQASYTPEEAASIFIKVLGNLNRVSTSGMVSWIEENKDLEYKLQKESTNHTSLF